jgi:hypothetical protein
VFTSVTRNGEPSPYLPANRSLAGSGARLVAKERAMQIVHSSNYIPPQRFADTVHLLRQWDTPTEQQRKGGLEDLGFSSKEEAEVYRTTEMAKVLPRRP